MLSRWTPLPSGTPDAGGYRRSTGSPRGEARRRELLDRVTDDLAANGLVDFSLRRAARAAGTTHKVLLYHFAGADDLLVQAILRLRDRRIEKGMAAAGQGADEQTLSARVRAIWPILIARGGAGARSGHRAGHVRPGAVRGLGRGASQQYLPSLLSLCPPDWSDQRKLQVAK